MLKNVENKLLFWGFAVRLLTFLLNSLDFLYVYYLICDSSKKNIAYLFYSEYKLRKLISICCFLIFQIILCAFFWRIDAVSANL